MFDGQDQRVMDRVLYRVDKFCLDGKYIEQRQSVGNEDGNGKGMTCPETCPIHQIPEDQPVNQQGPDCGVDQPDDGSLPEILPEGVKVIGRRIAFIILQLHAGIEERSGRYADRDDRNAGKNPQYVQYPKIADLAHKAPDGIVCTEKPHECPSSILSI